MKKVFENKILVGGICIVVAAILAFLILPSMYKQKEKTIFMICTPKVRHFWRCIFLWQRKGKNIENTRQNSNYLL